VINAPLTRPLSTQDGDSEGCPHLDRLPNAAEATAIREALGIRKRHTMTADSLDKLRVNLAKNVRPSAEAAVPPLRSQRYGFFQLLRERAMQDELNEDRRMVAKHAKTRTR
jgi:hypothetical protein